MMGRLHDVLFSLQIALLIFLMPVADGFAVQEENGRQGFSVDVLLEKERFTLSDTILVHLRAFHPADYRVDPAFLRAALLEYYGYGQPPFSFMSESLVKGGSSETWIDYRLTPNRTGSFQIGFGNIRFFGKDNGKSVSLLSPLKQVVIDFTNHKEDFLPPEPVFLFFKPLLPVEIDPLVRQALKSSPQVLAAEKNAWRHVFFLRKMPAVLFLTGSLLLICLMVFFAIRATRADKGRNPAIKARSILKELLRKMQDIRKGHRQGTLSSNDALVQYQKAMVECFELRFEIPLSSLTIEELKELLLKAPGLSEVKMDDLNQLLDKSIGIKFGKESVVEEEAGSIMDDSLAALKNIVRAIPEK